MNVKISIAGIVGLCLAVRTIKNKWDEHRKVLFNTLCFFNSICVLLIEVIKRQKYFNEYNVNLYNSYKESLNEIFKEYGYYLRRIGLYEQIVSFIWFLELCAKIAEHQNESFSSTIIEIENRHMVIAERIDEEFKKVNIFKRFCFWIHKLRGGQVANSVS